MKFYTCLNHLFEPNEHHILFWIVLFCLLSCFTRLIHNPTRRPTDLSPCFGVGIGCVCKQTLPVYTSYYQKRSCIYTYTSLQTPNTDTRLHLQWIFAFWSQPCWGFSFLPAPPGSPWHLRVPTSRGLTLDTRSQPTPSWRSHLPTLQ